MTDTNRFVGPYRLERRFARGGMAELFEATHLGAAGFERTVCLKTILPAFATDPEFRDLFVGEASLAGRLCHINMVQVFDCIQQGETLALVMEMVDGMDLKALIRRLRACGQVLPREVVVHVAGQVLAGLAYAHERKVVHRDISPHNVLVSRHGEVKITDFGVAKLMLSLGTRTHTIRGKLAYMSPEQASTGHVDHRTDLYSAGLVMYELVTGQRFFPQSSRADLMARIDRTGTSRIDEGDDGLGTVLERLLAPRPDDRFSSAQEALEALPPWRSLGPSGARNLAAIVRDLLAGDEIGPPVPGAPMPRTDPSLDDTEVDAERNALVPLDPPTPPPPRAGAGEPNGSCQARTTSMPPPRTSGQPHTGDLETHHLADTLAMPLIDLPCGGLDVPLLTGERLVLILGALLALLVTGLSLGACGRVAIEWAARAAWW